MARPSERILFLISAVVTTLALWGSSNGFCDSPEASDAAQGTLPSVYDLRFHLEVDGSIKFLSKTRYYRSEDLHLKLSASPCLDGWDFRSLRLVEDGDESDTVDPVLDRALELLRRPVEEIAA